MLKRWAVEPSRIAPSERAEKELKALSLAPICKNQLDRLPWPTLEEIHEAQISAKSVIPVILHYWASQKY